MRFKLVTTLKSLLSTQFSFTNFTFNGLSSDGTEIGYLHSCVVFKKLFFLQMLFVNCHCYVQHNIHFIFNLFPHEQLFIRSVELINRCYRLYYIEFLFSWIKSTLWTITIWIDKIIDLYKLWIYTLNHFNMIDVCRTGCN